MKRYEKNGYYYVDKTKLIEQLVENGSEVTLFTRPRRFGKTLNMSMLRSFFSKQMRMRHCLMGSIYRRKKELCDKYMGKHPVLFLSLKNVEGLTYEDAKYRITELIGIEAQHFFISGIK